MKPSTNAPCSRNLYDDDIYDQNNSEYPITRRNGDEQDVPRVLTTNIVNHARCRCMIREPKKFQDICKN